MTIAGLIRLRDKHHELVQGVREGRRLQMRNRATIADCERENAQLEMMIQANKDAARMLADFIRRAELRQHLPLAAE